VATSKIGAFLTKQTGGLPNWAWGAVVLVGVGAGILFLKLRPGGGGPPTVGPGTTVGGTASDTSQAGLNAASSPSLQNLPASATSNEAFPETTVGSNKVPVVPSGFSPVLDQNGNLIGYQAPQSSNGTPSNTSSASSTSGTKKVLTRGARADESAGSGKGLPIWKSPAADWSQVAGSVPLNQEIDVGSPVPGDYFGTRATYYPVSYNGVSGYIGSWDLSGTSVSDLSYNQPGQGDTGGSMRPRQVRGLLQ
jgi:hypothetical protein